MSKTFKIPKKIAGVKIPKALRKGPVGEFVKSPAGQALVAEVVALAIEAAPEENESAWGNDHGGLSQQRLARAFDAAIAAFRASLDGEETEPDARAAVDADGDEQPEQSAEESSVAQRGAAH